MAGLASAYALLDRDADAEKLYNEIVELQRRAANAQQGPMFAAISDTGWLQFRQQKYAEAEVNLKAALTGWERTQSETWERYNAESMLGVTLAAQGKYAEAEQHVCEAMSRLGNGNRLGGLSSRTCTSSPKNNLVSGFSSFMRTGESRRKSTSGDRSWALWQALPRSRQ
jgi:tetratricopeptide (TPR) repeat protein